MICRTVLEGSRSNIVLMYVLNKAISHTRRQQGRQIVVNNR